MQGIGCKAPLWRDAAKESKMAKIEKRELSLLEIAERMTELREAIEAEASQAIEKASELARQCGKAEDDEARAWAAVERHARRQQVR